MRKLETEFSDPGMTLEEFRALPSGTRILNADGDFVGKVPLWNDEGWGANKFSFTKELPENRPGIDRFSDPYGEVVTHVLLENQEGNQSIYYPLRRIRNPK